MHIATTIDIENSVGKKPRKLTLKDPAIIKILDNGSIEVEHYEPNTETSLTKFAGRVTSVPSSPFVKAGKYGIASTATLSMMNEQQLGAAIGTAAPHFGIPADRVSELANQIYSVVQRPEVKTIAVAVSVGVAGVGASDKLFPKMGVGWKLLIGLLLAGGAAYLAWWAFTGTRMF